MRIIRQYIPGFVSDIDASIAYFETVKDLLKVPFVERWTLDKSFYRFSLSDELLMAEFRSGYEWWVVGNINNIEGLDLPKWKAKYSFVMKIKKFFSKKGY